MKQYAEVDKTSFPIITVTFTGETATEDNFPIYLENVKKCYNHQEKIALIFDASKAVFPAIIFQKMQAKWLEENTQMIKDFCVGTAYIIPNIIIRNVLKAIFTFQTQPAPYVVCSNIVEAEIWINYKLNAS